MEDPETFDLINNNAFADEITGHIDAFLIPFALTVNQLETVFEIVLGIVTFFSTWTIGDSALWSDADKWYINIVLLTKYGVGINEIIDGTLGLYDVTYATTPEYDLLTLYSPLSYVLIILFYCESIVFQILEAVISPVVKLTDSIEITSFYSLKFSIVYKAAATSSRIIFW